MEIDVISESEVRQIALNTVCEYIKDDEWCEDGSVRMDIKHLNKVVGDLKMDVKRLKPSDGINSSAIDMLLERVKVLENEMIDKDLRISKLEQEVIEKL